MSFFDRLAVHPLRAGALCALLVVGMIAILSLIGGAASNAPDQSWYGDAFAVRGGEKRTLGRALVLPTRESGTQLAPTIATIENLSLAARDYPLAEVTYFERDRAHRLAIIWRNDVEPGVTQRMELESGASHHDLVQLSTHPGWRGTIRGVGLIGGHPNNRPLTVAKFSLLPDTVAARWAQLTGDVQKGLSRPQPGQEAVVKARQMWLLPWWIVGGLLVCLGLAWAGARRVGPRAVAIAALLATGALTAAGGWVRQTDLADGSTARSVARPATAESLRTALAAAPATATVYVMSGDSRGRELALAVAPRRAIVRLAGDALPLANGVQAGDIFVVLARRGVRYIPKPSGLEWTVAVLGADAPQRVAAELLAAGDGEAVFKVNP
jgi:hypothetical protein